jgi:hypothetical protein
VSFSGDILSAVQRRLLHAIAAVLLLSSGSSRGAVSITEPTSSVFDFTATAAELSGLAWTGGNSYVAISDDVNQRRVYQLSIDVDPANGRVTNAVVTGTNTLSTGYDLEGIAYAPHRGTFFISDEGQHPNGGFLREHTLPDGALVRSLTIPATMLNDRPNYGFESCSWGAGALWTANEEALTQESALATATNGSLVRLLKFDHQLNAVGQWVYETDSFGFDSSLTTAERSGVSDLLALPDGNLLVLERALGFGVIPSYRNRIYLVNFAGASDVSGIADLDGATYTAVSKTLLWERNFGSIATRNFEGLALGPALPALGANSYSLVLVADNGGGTQQHLFALVLNGLAVPSAVAQWRQTYWGTTNNTGVSANDFDPDGDGLLNLLEFGLGRNPTTSDAVGAISLLNSNGVIGLGYSLTNTATGVLVQTERNGTGLTTNAWTTAGIVENRVTNATSVAVEAWAVDPPAGTLTNLFLRLRAMEF